MSFLELLLIAVGLSMDAFAVSVCKGLAMKGAGTRAVLACGIWFGAFQALMPAIGYFLGSSFSTYVEKFSPWIAFVLLAAIGSNMIRESLSGQEEEANGALDPRTMAVMAVATSIDALAVGITFAVVPLDLLGIEGPYAALLTGVLIIGLTTFIISGIGVKIGSLFGAKYKTRAEIAGGVILICIGLKILLEHIL